MKKKTIISIILVTICLFCICFSACEDQGTQKSANGIDWITDECYFVDYTIEENIVKFRYVLTFENTYHRDMIISFPQVSFKQRELRGWIEHKDAYVGVSENGTTDSYVPAGEKVSIVFVFEGNYLGGDVNTELSAPTTIVFGQKLVPQTTEDLEDDPVVP